MSKFRGVVGGVEYSEPGLFEQAARALGYRRNGDRVSRWKVGTAIRVRFHDGPAIDGQVWALADVRNYVWVALDNGKFVCVFAPTGQAYDYPSTRSTSVGRVAA